MSDNLRIDKKDMHSIVRNFPLLLQNSGLDSVLLEQLAKMQARGPSGVCFIGMGGSAISGDYVATALKHASPLPIVSVRDQNLPAYVRKGYVVFATSYSGNTQETLAAQLISEERGCHTITVSSGGLLSKKAATSRIRLPTGFPPRGALPIMFGKLLQATEVLLGLPVTNLDDLAEEINRASQSWGVHMSKPSELAKSIHEKIPIFMAAGHLYPSAYRAKCQINENAKTEAFSSPLPEATHNEIEGFTEARAGSLVPVLLRSKTESPTTKRRLDIVYDILRETGYDCTVVSASAQTALGEMLEMTYYLDLASVELADLIGVDSLSVPKISSLKKRL